MHIHLAETDAEIAGCHPAMQTLRPQIAEADFVSRIRRQQASGYRLAFVEQDGMAVAVAGFRLGENLAWGRFLYVDDLVTLPNHRSQGLGATLPSWLRAFAVQAGCQQLHLDSGLHRADAHRFYEREGMSKHSFHFAENLAPDGAGG
jgi:GNAT superfamily N-acetyltransferase